jgi:hypothetical protein
MNLIVQVRISSCICNIGYIDVPSTLNCNAIQILYRTKTTWALVLLTSNQHSEFCPPSDNVEQQRMFLLQHKFLCSPWLWHHCKLSFWGPRSSWIIGRIIVLWLCAHVWDASKRVFQSRCQYIALCVCMFTYMSVSASKRRYTGAWDLQLLVYDACGIHDTMAGGDRPRLDYLTQQLLLW